MVLNTSFNENEPVVCKPQEALDCFLRTRMDVLVMGEGVVRRLTALHEADRPEPWSVEDAPEKFVDGQLRAIVGIEIRIERVEAKVKLSQNRPEGDRDGVVRGLRSVGDIEGADAVATHRP